MTENNAGSSRSWSEGVRALRHPRVLAMLFLGFSAGIPLVLIFSTLSVRLREAGVERSMVTFFTWGTLAYSFKYVWAPLVDRLPVPGLTAALGRRRGWLLASQFVVIACILWMAAADPQGQLVTLALATAALGFASATQDIVIDAYRIEAVDVDLQPMAAAAYLAGYRAGMLLAGAGALILASVLGGEHAYSATGWMGAYACMALAMLAGVATTLLVDEPRKQPVDDQDAFRTTADYVRFLTVFATAATAFVLGFFSSRGFAENAKRSLIDGYGLQEHLVGFAVESARLSWSILLAAALLALLIACRAAPFAMVRQAYVAPIADFFRRYGKAGLIIVLLIGSYRLSDMVLGAVANMFYIDHGFSKQQIALISKTFGLFMTLAGGFLGGVLSVRYGMRRTLFLGALLSAATNLLFAYLATVSADPRLLVAVITADNLSGGLATAAFIAYLSSLTNVSFTATQYALFSSLMTLFPNLLNGYSGTIVDAIGYPSFFVLTAVMGVPVLLLVLVAARVDG